MRMRLTWAEHLVEEGRKSGLEVGRREGVEIGKYEGLVVGRREGFEQGARAILLHMLGLCFGPLPDDVTRWMEEIHSVDRLCKIAGQILVARSLEEIGLQ